MNTEEILRILQTKDHLSIDESFNCAKVCSVKLRNNDEDGRRIIIHILDNFKKIPAETVEMWTDLIEQAGFYPYLEMEKSRLLFDNLAGEIRKEYHLSENLGNKYFHEEQRILKNLLESDKNLIVSAPTSFGKSLLIEEMVASKKYKNIVIIQPTLALLDETRKRLKKYKNNYKIILRTTQPPATDKGNLFLLTAERVVEYPSLPKIDFLVIDEFYKLSTKRDDERAYILNNAFYMLLTEHQPKFYLLGPNIDDISEGFSEKYNAIFYKTDYSLIDNKIIDVYSKHKEMFDKPQKNKEYKENVLFELLLELKYEQTIIYCSSPAKVRELSKKFCNFLKEKNIQKNEELPLVEWIEKNIHPEWTLIDLLNHHIGINDGALLKHINSSMIDYFNDGKLKYLFCTTTIIEGVNTSAKNVIFFDNKKGRTKIIDYFDYSNIKGRSGRLMIHYIGKIYNFNPPPKKQEEMIIDIPFFQQNPIEDEVLNGLKDEDIKPEVKQTEQFKKLEKIPKEERELFQKNGVSIEGQKRILEQLKKDLNSKKHLIKWHGKPNYEQLKYVLELAWDNLLKQGETTFPMTKKRVTKVTVDYGNSQNIDYLIDSTYRYFKQENKYPNKTDIEIINEALRESFNILRHWFQYKVPKWLNVINSLQIYVFMKENAEHGDYSYYASQIENDFVPDKLAILLEYGIPKSAIVKLETKIDYSDLDEDTIIEKIIQYVKKNPDMFLEYERKKIEGSL